MARSAQLRLPHSSAGAGWQQPEKRLVVLENISLLSLRVQCYAQ